MKRALRLLTTLLLPLVIGSCCVLRCNTKLPTPIISGPDSGWTRSPILFRARMKDGSGAPYTKLWTWGDGTTTSAGSDPMHAYGAPGSYVVTCQVVRVSTSWPAKPVFSDTSAPITVQIIPDTLVFPDTLTAIVATGAGKENWGGILPQGDRLYVTNSDAGMVRVVDIRTNAVVDSVVVPTSPSFCVAAHSGLYVYVSSAASRAISVIRTSDDSVINTLQLAYEPGRLALSPSDSFLYVSHHDSGLVSVIRLGDGSRVARIPVGGTPDGMAATSDGASIYVACGTSGEVAVIRTADNSVTSALRVGGTPTDVAFSPTGETAYVSCSANDSIVLLRKSDHSRIGSVCLDSMGFSRPARMAVTHDGACLYVLSDYAGSMVILRRSDNYMLRLYLFDFMQLGHSVRDIVLHPDGDHAYVPTDGSIGVFGLRPSR